MREESAGCVLVDRVAVPPRVLLIRVRKEGFEIPKGHIEAGESAEVAALRELREETGLLSGVLPTSLLGILEYTFQRDARNFHKRVQYFLAAPETPVVFGAKPGGTRELFWVVESEAETVTLVDESLRPLLRDAFRRL